MSVDIEEFDTIEKPDFRRANGAPMVIIDGKNARLSRPSGFGKILDDESALTNWRINKAIKGTAGDPAIQARAVAAKDDDREAWKNLRDASIQAGRGDEAADIGTALHAMSERWEDPDDDFTPPEPFLSSLTAYTDALDHYGLVSTHFEFQCVNLDYRTAGTCDRIYRTTRPLMAPNGAIIPEGTSLIGDLKTGKSMEYSLAGYTIQMALYAQSKFYDVVADEFIETPEINQDWGILVHMPSNADTCQLLWIDLEAGNYGAWLVSELKEWRRKWRNGTHSAPVIQLPMSDEEVAVALDATALVGDEWVTEMLGFCRARMALIRADDEAVKTLVERWPTGLPKPAAITEAQHVSDLLTHLDNVEAHHGLTFPEDDPRVTPVGSRRDGSRTTNTPPKENN